MLPLSHISFVLVSRIVLMMLQLHFEFLVKVGENATNDFRPANSALNRQQAYLAFLLVFSSICSRSSSAPLYAASTSNLYSSNL